MSLTVRGLLPQVAPFRRDFEEERSIYAIQEAVRKVCRQTMLAQEVITGICGDATIVTINPSTGNSLNRVHKLEILDNQGRFSIMDEYNQAQIDNIYRYPDQPTGIPMGYSYVGKGQIHLYPSPQDFPISGVVIGNIYGIHVLGNTAWASFGATAVNATSLVVGQTYIINTPGTTDFTLVGATSSAAGTVFTAAGVGIGSGTTFVRNFTATGVPTGTGTLAQMLRATISDIPVGEFDTIPLPDEAQECIVAGAIATILSLPGTGQNLSYSKDRETLHNRELGVLKAIAVLGQSGRNRATGRILGGRQMVLFDSRRYL